MTLIKMNRTGVVEADFMMDPPEELVKNTLPLFRASLEDAVRYGGDVTRAALGAMNIRGDRKYVVVDTKVHMLMPGFMPGIPGWHTDGVPRRKDGCAEGNDPPDIFMQEKLDEDPENRPRYHLLVTGDLCPTRFVAEPYLAQVPDEPSHDLYKVLSEYTQAQVANSGPYADVDLPPISTFETEPSVVYEWDWWAVHTVQKATKRGWRFLIRVTETDWLEPTKRLEDVIRTQSNVYVESTNMGW